MGPFDTFASYPTRHVTATTLVAAVPGLTKQAYRDLIALDINALWKVAPAVVDRILDLLEAGPLSVGDLAAATEMEAPLTTEIVARLAKIDAVVLAAT